MQFAYDAQSPLFVGFNLKISPGSRCLFVGANGSVEGVDPVRREKLIELLEIDLQWRMHTVSDGQRRRVLICTDLLHPFQVLLLDEITGDLDVVARLDLLGLF